MAAPQIKIGARIKFPFPDHDIEAYFESFEYQNGIPVVTFLDKDGIRHRIFGWHINDIVVVEDESKAHILNLKHLLPEINTENVSDGYHTFAELYEARCVLTAGYFNLLAKTGVETCKSWKHFDGEPCFGGGWFIVMANLPSGQVSFHYPEKNWNLFDLPERETGFVLDGHTTADVYERILNARYYEYLT